MGCWASEYVAARQAERSDEDRRDWRAWEKRHRARLRQEFHEYVEMIPRPVFGIDKSTVKHWRFWHTQSIRREHMS
jgi:hypothetical protein